MVHVDACLDTGEQKTTRVRLSACVFQLLKIVYITL